MVSVIVSWNQGEHCPRDVDVQIVPQNIFPRSSNGKNEAIYSCTFNLFITSTMLCDVNQGGRQRIVLTKVYTKRLDDLVISE